MSSPSKLRQPVTLGWIVQSLGGDLHASADLLIDELSALDRAGERSIAFLSDPKRMHELAACQAACVVLSRGVAQLMPERSAVVVDNPYLYYARLSQLWQKLNNGGARFAAGIHPSAVVHPEAVVHPSAHVGPHCVVEKGARIGADSVLRSGVWLGDYCEIGQRCLIQPGAVIGGDGFGFAQDRGQWIKIEQLGRVIIGNDVEVGANTCIDRGALNDTIIGDGVKLDNQIQIGHNTQIGENAAMAGCVGVAGSAKIGAGCTVGGAGMILGHLELADGVHISAASVVTKSIRKPGLYTGFFPLSDNATWERNAATTRQLGALRDRVKALEEELQSLYRNSS